MDAFGVRIARHTSTTQNRLAGLVISPVFFTFQVRAERLSCIIIRRVNDLRSIFKGFSPSVSLHPCPAFLSALQNTRPPLPHGQAHQRSSMPEQLNLLFVFPEIRKIVRQVQRRLRHKNTQNASPTSNRTKSWRYSIRFIIINSYCARAFNLLPYVFENLSRSAG